MAAEKERLSLLSKIQSIQKEISDLETDSATSSAAKLKNEIKLKSLKEEILKNARILQKVNEEITTLAKQYLTHQADQEARIKNIADQQFRIKDIEKKRLANYNSIDTKITSNLETFNKMADVNIEISKLDDDEISKKALLNLEYDSLANSLDMRGSKMKEQLGILGEQNKLANQYASLSETQRDVLEGQRKVLDGIKTTIIATYETAKTLYGNLLGATGGIITLVGVWEHKVTDVNKELGFTILDMNSAAKSAGLLGFIFDDVAGTVKAITNEFGSLESATLKTQFRVGAMSSLMGITNSEAAQLVGQFARMNNGSSDIATDMIQTTKEYAKQNNVIPSQVLSDLAGNAEAFAIFADDGGKNLIKAATGAAKLGTNLGTVVGIADSLLDFETSMTNELELSAMLGRNINLSKARQLAYDGKLVEATQETLKQVGGIEAFNRMDYFQKKQTAALLGVSVAELQKMTTNQEKVGKLGEIVNSTFSDLGATLNMIANKYLGHGIEAMGGMLTATGQWSRGLQAVGIDTGKIAGNLAAGAKSLLSKGWDLLKGSGATESIAGSMGDTVKKTVTDKTKETITDKLKDVGSDKVDELKDSVTDKLKGGGEEKIGGTTKSISKIDVTKVLQGALAMVAVAGAIWIFSKALQELEKIEDWKSIAIGLGAFAATMGAIAIVGKPASIGLTALGGGLKSLANPQTLIGLAALTIAAMGFGYALNLAAPGIEAFGNVMQKAFTGLPPIITAIADGLVSIMGAITIEKATAMVIMGAGMGVMAAGLTTLGVASFLAGDSVSDMFEKMTRADLSTTSTALMGMGAGLSLIATQLDRIDTTKLDALSDFSISASIGTAVSGIAESIGGVIDTVGNILGTEKVSDYETKMLDKMDNLINAVNSNRDVYLDKEKVTSIVKKTSDKHTSNSSFGLAGA